ncbi:siphovirus Gp157 family protein, partial [Lactobacillus gasseri]
MKIYEINEKIQELQNKDIEPELLKDTLESLQLELNIKLDSIASWIESNKMKIDWCKKKKLDFA